MGKSSAEFSLVIGTVDKFTAPFKAFGSAMDAGAGKLKKLGSEFAKFKKNLDKTLGFSQTKAALNGLGQGFAKVGGEVRNLFGTLAKFSTVGGLVSGGLAGGIYKLTKDFADAGAQADEMAQKLGLTAQQWQSMAYAAKMNGVEANELQSSYEGLNKSLIAAAQGGKTQAAAFKTLGVGLKSLTEKGKLKNTDLLMTEVAEAFSKMEDGARKSALATQIFGGAGVKLLPTLNKGAAGLKELREKAAELGLVFDGEAVAAGAAFNETLDGTRLKVKGLAYSIGSAFLPFAQSMVGTLGELIDENRGLIKTKITEWAEKFRKKLPELKQGLKDFVGAVPEAIKRVNKFAESLGGWGRLGKLAALVMGGPLIRSIVGLVGPLKSLGWAIMTTPLGFLLGIGAAFAALMVHAGVMGPFLDGVSAGFSSVSGALSESFVGLVESLGKSFGGVTDGLRNAKGEMDPEAWKKLGEAIGTMAGGGLTDLVDLLTKAVDLFGKLGGFLGDTAFSIAKGTDVIQEDWAMQAQSDLDREMEAHKAENGGVASPTSQKNYDERQQFINDAMDDAHHPWRRDIFGSKAGRRKAVNYLSDQAEKIGTALGVTPGGYEGGRLAKPSGYQSATWGAPLLEKGLGGAVKREETQHTEIHRGEIDVRVHADPGSTATVTSNGLPSNVQSSNSPIRVGVTNMGG